jgi:hypothetical protein
MKLGIACIVLVFACGKSGEDQAKEDMAKQAAQEAQREAESKPKVVKETPVAPPPTEVKPDAAPMPEPTTPEEIDKAFKQAMIDGHDKDVLKYCGMLKLDDKSNPQSIMGCTLAACRTNDPDTAKRYAGFMPKTKDGTALLLQAKKVCLVNKVPI